MTSCSDESPEFEMLAKHIRQAGEPYPGSVLRCTAQNAVLACSACGVLPWADGKPVTTWITLAQRAIRHCEEHPGHQVAADCWNAAIYGKAAGG